MVALTVFGFALAGVAAIASTQLRLMAALETRVRCQVPQGAGLSLARDVVDRNPAAVDPDRSRPEPGIAGPWRRWPLVVAVSGNSNPVLVSADRWARRMGLGTPVIAVSARPGSDEMLAVARPILGIPGLPYEAIRSVELLDLTTGEATGTATVRVLPAGAEP